MSNEEMETGHEGREGFEDLEGKEEFVQVVLVTTHPHAETPLQKPSRFFEPFAAFVSRPSHPR
jgi:hypothetical protein